MYHNLNRNKKGSLKYTCLEQTKLQHGGSIFIEYKDLFKPAFQIPIYQIKEI